MTDEGQDGNPPEKPKPKHRMSRREFLGRGAVALGLVTGEFVVMDSLFARSRLVHLADNDPVTIVPAADGEPTYVFPRGLLALSKEDLKNPRKVADAFGYMFTDDELIPRTTPMGVDIGFYLKDGKICHVQLHNITAPDGEFVNMLYSLMHPVDQKRIVGGLPPDLDKFVRELQGEPNRFRGA